MVTTIFSSVYGQSLVLAISLLIVAIISKGDQADMLTYGMYFFITWYIVEFIFVIRSDSFWHASFHLGLASLAVFIFYIVLTVLSEKFGTPARADGAGFGMLMPVFLFMLVFLFVLLIKGVMVLWNYIFS